MKSKSIPETREKYYETFVEMTRENLHIVFCTSPVGDALRLRFRKFPALINCCTLNWFINWPQEALISCCKRVFQQKLTYPDTVKDTLVTLSTTAHSNVEELTERYFTELSRRVYVTPKSFLDMIDLSSVVDGTLLLNQVMVAMGWVFMELKFFIVFLVGLSF
jgi:dynein heavy chain